MKGEKLTPKQETFCLEYAKSGNATEAAEKAGYKNPRQLGSENLSKLVIQSRIKELTKKKRGEKIADVKEAQETLTAIMRQETTEEVILPNGDRVQRKPTLREVTKAAETLLRTQGGFIDRQQVELSGAIPVVIRDDL